MKKPNRKKARKASPAEKVDEVRATLAAETIGEAEVIPKGLVEISIKDSAFKLLGMRNQAAVPTLEQRTAIARRLNRIGPKLPRYVKQILQDAKPRAAYDAAFGSNGKGDPMKHKQVVTDGHGKVRETTLKEEALTGLRKLKKEHNIASPVTSVRIVHTVLGEKPKSNGADPGVKVKGVSSPAPRGRKGAAMEPKPVPKGGFTKDNKPETSGELIRSRIAEHRMTDDAIAAEVRKLWPGRTTKVSDVRWNRAQMQKAGVKKVPDPVAGSTVPGGKK